MWQEDTLEPLQLPSPALGAAGAGAEAKAAATMPALALPPVRETSAVEAAEPPSAHAEPCSAHCGHAGPAGLLATPAAVEAAQPSSAHVEPSSASGGGREGQNGGREKQKSVEQKEGEGSVEQEDKEAVLASPTSSEVDMNGGRGNSLPCSPPSSPSMRVPPVKPPGVTVV